MGGKMHGLGYFHDQLEAAAAYDVEAKKVHKGKAVLNFPGRKGSQVAWQIKQSCTSRCLFGGGRIFMNEVCQAFPLRASAETSHVMLGVENGCDPDWLGLLFG